jgi:hypothetical protein
MVAKPTPQAGFPHARDMPSAYVPVQSLATNSTVLDRTAIDGVNAYRLSDGRIAIVTVHVLDPSAAKQWGADIERMSGDVGWSASDDLLKALWG